MSESVDLLLEVQRLDMEIVELLGKLNQARATLDVPPELVATRTELQRVEDHLQHLSATQRDHEGELASLRSTVTTMEKRLYGDVGNNARAVAPLQTEIAHRKEQMGRIEDQVVELMVQIDDQEAEKRRLRDSVIALEALHAGRLPELQSEVTAVEERIAALKARRASVAGRVPPADLQVYRALAASGKGRPVVRMSGGTCHACGATLPTAEAQKLRRSTDLPRCPRCGHIVKFE